MRVWQISVAAATHQDTDNLKRSNRDLQQFQWRGSRISEATQEKLSTVDQVGEFVEALLRPRAKVRHNVGVQPLLTINHVKTSPRDFPRSSRPLLLRLVQYGRMKVHWSLRLVAVSRLPAADFTRNQSSTKCCESRKAIFHAAVD